MKTEISIELLANYVTALFNYPNYATRQKARLTILDLCHEESNKTNPNITLTHLVYLVSEFAKREKDGFLSYNTEAMKDLVLTLFQKEVEATTANNYDNIAEDIMKTVFLSALDYYKNENNKTIAECWELLNNEVSYYTHS